MNDEERKKQAIKTKDRAMEIGNQLVNFLNENSVEPKIALLAMSLVVANIASNAPDQKDQKDVLSFFNGAAEAALKDIALDEQVNTAGGNHTLQ